MLKQNTQPAITYNNKTNANPELSVAVLHPNADLYQVKIVPGVIKTLIRLFCATPGADSTQLRARPDYKAPRVWGPENQIRNLAILISRIN